MQCHAMHCRHSVQHKRKVKLGKHQVATATKQNKKRDDGEEEGSALGTGGTWRGGEGGVRRGGDNKTCPTGEQGERARVRGWNWQGKPGRHTCPHLPAAAQFYQGRSMRRHITGNKHCPSRNARINTLFQETNESMKGTTSNTPDTRLSVSWICANSYLNKYLVYNCSRCSPTVHQ